jgi:hypothetical protein
MTAVRVRCSTCCATQLVPLDTMHALVCRDDEGLNVYGFTCETCGPRLNPMSRHEFHALDAAGIVTCYWDRSEVAAEVRREHLSLIKEFSERLEDTLDRILDEAC